MTGRRLHGFCKNNAEKTGIIARFSPCCPVKVTALKERPTSNAAAEVARSLFQMRSLQRID